MKIDLNLTNYSFKVKKTDIKSHADLNEISKLCSYVFMANCLEIYIPIEDLSRIFTGLKQNEAFDMVLDTNQIALTIEKHGNIFNLSFPMFKEVKKARGIC